MAPKIRGNSLYTTVDGPSWTQAEANSVALGGHLTAFNDIYERQWLSQNVYGNQLHINRLNADQQIIGDLDGYFVGLNDKEVNGELVWTGDVNTPLTDSSKYIHPVHYADKVYLLPNFEYGAVHSNSDGATPNILFNLGENHSYYANAGISYKGIAEIPLTSSITFSTTPKEGAGIFTTSINLSAGTEASGNLAEGATVYWKVTGITADDLESGALTGSGVITNGKLDIQHSLAQDNDTGESFEVSIFSDSSMTAEHQIGTTAITDIEDQPAASVKRAIAIKWLHTYGTAGTEAISDVSLSRDGSKVYSAGTIGDGAGSTDIYIEARTIDGVLLWEKQYGTSSEESFSHIVEGLDGNLYLAATSKGGAMFGYTPKGGLDAYLAKLDGSGNLISATQVATGTNDWTYGILQKRDGTLCLYGPTGWNSTLGGNTPYGYHDGFIAQFDEDLNSQGIQLVGDARNGGASSLVEGENGQLFLAAESQEKPIGATNAQGMIWNIHEGAMSEFLRAGAYPGRTGLTGITADGKGSLYAVGYSDSQVGASTTSGGADFLVIKLNYDGSVVWSKHFGGIGEDIGRAITMLPNGSIAVAGYTSGGSYGNPHAGGSDALVLEIDPSGNLVDSFSFGTPGDDWIFSIDASTSGEVYVGGFLSGSLHGQGFKGGTDGFIASLQFGDSKLLPEINITVAPAAVAEDGTANLIYTFSRTGPTNDALTVNYTVSGTATEGIDYASVGTTVVIAAGSSTATVIVDPTAEGAVEVDETVTLTLVSGSAYTIGSNPQATGTITNDDRAYSGDYDWTLTGTPNSGRIIGELTDDAGEEEDDDDGTDLGKSLFVEDELTNISSVIIVGGASSNTIDASGWTGDTTQNGGAEEDLLIGGSGFDSLTGGADEDQFRFIGWNSDRSSPDHIIDFNRGEEDEIEISVSGFGIVPDPLRGSGDDRRGRGRGRGRGGRSETDSLKASLTNVDSAGLDAALEGKNLFVYNRTTGELWLNQNWSSSGAGDGGVIAVLENKPTLLGASDISLIG